MFTFILKFCVEYFLVLSMIKLNWLNLFIVGENNIGVLKMRNNQIVQISNIAIALVFLLPVMFSLNQRHYKNLTPVLKSCRVFTRAAKNQRNFNSELTITFRRIGQYS